MKDQYDLAVAYRICPHMPAKEMAIFAQNKLNLSEFCLRSFKRSLGSLRAKMWVLLDNCPAEYEALFLKYFNKKDLNFVKLPGIGNEATFALQLKILTDQNDAEIVYLAEDDYFFQPNQFREMIDFLKHHSDVHFVSPYDHPDYYKLDVCKHNYELREYSNHHWRTAIATTLSFLTTKHVLMKTKKALSAFGDAKAKDYSIWVSLTKYNVFNPFKPLKYLVSDKYWFSMSKNTWVYCWNQILFGNRWKLWVPLPSIATHMEKKFLAPCIDWEETFAQEILRERQSKELS